MIAFAAILLIISVSVVITNEQIFYVYNQQDVSGNIERGSDALNIVSSQYFLYQQASQISDWQSIYTAISGNLSSLSSNSSVQRTLVSTIKDDLDQLNVSFGALISYLESQPRNLSVRIIPEFQVLWNQLATQHQKLASDASKLSQSLRNEADQLRQTNLILIVALIGIFAAFFGAIYFLFYRRTLKSIENLQTATNIVGSGNLDYRISVETNDEVGDLSGSFNQMANNLKNVTASKIDLEKEIAERKKAESALRHSEERWSTTLSSIGDAVIATDVLGKVTFMNNIAETLVGWTFAEANQRSLQEVFHIINEETRQEVGNPVMKVLASGVIVGLANHSVLVRRDGSEIPIDDSGSPIKDQNGQVTGVVLVLHDITERKQTEQELDLYRKHLEEIVEEKTKQLNNSERLAAIGQTAGMVGHDIRNPLQSITGDVYLAKSELNMLAESEERKNALESLDEIEKNVDYINKIVADLQDFARPLHPHAQKNDIKAIIEESLGNHEIPTNVKVSVKVKSDAREIMADSGYLKRIVSNLVLNAVQAMPDGGKLSILVEKDHQTGNIMLAVGDTGVGIPEDVKDKLFTPMFTTKSKGQGFGLAVVKRMTEALKGTVTFESENGKGTKFIVGLPSNAGQPD
jgi:PAS domain S-box-containing protein